MRTIGRWDIDYENLEVSCESTSRKLTPLAMDVLTHLCRNAHRVVSVDELLDAYWPTKYVGNNAVHKVVTEIRQALDDSRESRRYIQTVRKRGYKIIAAVAFDSSQSSPDMEVRLEESNWFPHMSLNRDLLRDALPLSAQSNITTDISMTGEHFPADSKNVYDTLIKSLLNQGRITVIETDEGSGRERPDSTISFELFAPAGRNDKRLRISLRDNTDQAIILTDTFDLANDQDRFELEIQTRLIPSLIVMMDATARRRMTELGAKDPVAYSKYAEALPYCNAYTYLKEDLEHSNRLFREAIKLDPGFLMPTVRLAWNMETTLHGRNPTDWEQIESELLDELRRIAKIDPNWWGLDVIRWVLGRFSNCGHKDSARQLRKIINAQSPFRDSAIAHYGQILIGAGIHDKGLELLDLYAKRFPDGQIFDGRAHAEYYLFGPERAYETLRDLSLQFPARLSYQASLVPILIKLERLEEAENVARRVAELDQYGHLAPMADARVKIAKGTQDLGSLLRKQSSDFARGLVCFLCDEVQMGCEYWLNENRPRLSLALSHYQSWHEAGFPASVVQSDRYQSTLESVSLGKPWVNFLQSEVKKL